MLVIVIVIIIIIVLKRVEIREQRKKKMKGGANFIDGLMKMIKGEKPQETILTTDSNVSVQPSTAEIARQETKTLSEFRKFGRNKI